MPSSRVLPEWIDYNGHMNVAYYVLAFDHAVDPMLEMFGIGPGYIERTGASQFVLESHVTYLRELTQGDGISITLQLLDFDNKRIHYFMSMYHQEQCYLAATSEQISTHVDLNTRRSVEFPKSVSHRLAQVMKYHGDAPTPSQAGNVIGIRRKG
ncbi:MAG: thioesterase family protein [Gammaproteobacteria bacterium]|nr:thioesterase family protein [Gammaproteobacteria bacterium]